MTAEHFDDDAVGQRLAKILETKANTVEVGNSWDLIERRALLESDGQALA